MGQPLKDIAGLGLIGLTGGASLGLKRDEKDNEPREVRQDAASKAVKMEPQKSRKERLAQARGRSSFRVALGAAETTGPRQTRAGLQIVG